MKKTNSSESLINELKTDGILGIQNLLARRVAEQYFVDFKATQLPDYSKEKALNTNDRKNLAKAISGFGNSEGGLIIWGISTQGEGDFANSSHPIKPLSVFLSLINNSLSRLTVPAHNSVESFSIKEKDGTDSGYAVTIIPKYEGLPIQTIEGEKFYMRSGDSFMGIPHAILAGMFGKRPNPDVYSMFTTSMDDPQLEEDYIKFEIGIQLVNAGKAIARDLFVNSTIFNQGKESKVEFTAPDPNFTAYSIFGVSFNLMSKKDFRLAPGQRIQPVVLNFLLKPPFTNDFYFKLTVGADGQMPHEHESSISAVDLQAMYDRCLIERNKDFAAKLLNMDYDKEQFLSADKG